MAQKTDQSTKQHSGQIQRAVKESRTRLARISAGRRACGVEYAAAGSMAIIRELDMALLAFQQERDLQMALVEETQRAPI